MMHVDATAFQVRCTPLRLTMASCCAPSLVKSWIARASDPLPAMTIATIGYASISYSGAARSWKPRIAWSFASTCSSVRRQRPSARPNPDAATTHRPSGFPRRFRSPSALQQGVDREEATRALEVLRKVVGQTRDDSAMQNWGRKWMLQAFVNGGAFAATNALLDHGVFEPWPFATLWGAAIGLDLLIVLTLARRRSGVRSFVETQIWTIWTTFIAAVSLVALLNHAMGLRTFFLGPVIGALAGVAFATMGSILGRKWFVIAGVFAVTSIVMAYYSAQQFYVLAVVWGCTQFAAGFGLERARRGAEPSAARIV